MDKEKNLLKAADDLFKLANAKQIGQHLSETISEFVTLNLKTLEVDTNNKELSDKVYLQAALINFFHELEKAHNSIKSK